MTLLELLNLSASILLLPNDDGQPSTFPTPSIGDYLTDLAHYLRTHMPYVDDLHQTGIQKYLIAETVFIYFFLIAGLRRFRLAQFYLLAKLVTFALFFLTSGLSYWNFLAWILCFVVYPLEVLVMFMFAAWFFHRHSLSKINRKTGVYRVDKLHIIQRWRKDGSIYWEKGKSFYAIRGLFTPDRLTYHWAFIIFYSYAKYRMLLGNPLAYFYKLYLDYSVDNFFLVEGPEFDPEFGNFTISWTTKFSDKLYRLVGRKYPLVKEFHRQAEAGGIYIENVLDKTSFSRLHRQFVDILQIPTVGLFGFKFPWVVEQDRFRTQNAERWLAGDTLPYKWVPVEPDWLTEQRKNLGLLGTSRKLYQQGLKKREEKAFKRYVQPIPEPTVKKIVSPRKLGQRIIDNLASEQFISTRDAILTCDNKRYTVLTSAAKRAVTKGIPVQGYRYKLNARVARIAYSSPMPRRGFTGLWIFRYPHIYREGRNFEEMPFHRLRRVRPRLSRSSLYQPNLPCPALTMRDHRYIPIRPRFYTNTRLLDKHGYHRHYTVPPNWRKEYQAPDARTGFTGFNFEQFAPLMELDSISNLRYGLLFILALSSLTVYSIILAGWSSNSKYAFLGALRSAAQMISYEVSISLALLPVILLSGSLNLTAIVYGQIETVWYLFPLLPIALVFLVSMLAETNRTPFDLPEAEAELVAGYNVDYSSLPFAMFFLGEYSNMILISVLFCLLFLGGWDGAVTALQEPYVLTIKAAFVWVFFVIVRATLPRYRYDQLMDIGWKAFLPFAGSFLVFVIGLVIFLDVAPVVEEVALEDLYGAPAPFLTELPATAATNSQPLTLLPITSLPPPWGATMTLPPPPATPQVITISTATKQHPHFNQPTIVTTLLSATHLSPLSNLHHAYTDYLPRSPYLQTDQKLF